MPRFTDAELAAEAYRQMVRACAEAGMGSMNTGTEILSAPMDAMEGFIGPIRKETYMLGVINRFARLPSI